MSRALAPTGELADLFLDSIAEVPLRDDRALMEFPFFSLSKDPRKTPFVYDDGAVRIEVRPGDRGMATIWDKDVLIFVTSILNDRRNRGLLKPSGDQATVADMTVRFTAHDFMRLTGRGTGIQGYKMFRDAMDRLSSTRIITTIVSAGVRETGNFGWIQSWRALERTMPSGKTVMAGVEVVLNAWMYRGIVGDGRVLTINRDYFNLGRGIERRLYELARKHCGSQGCWSMALENLHNKCGSVDGNLRRFRANIRSVAARDTLPDYTVELLPAGVRPEGYPPHLSLDAATELVCFRPLSKAVGNLPDRFDAVPGGKSAGSGAPFDASGPVGMFAEDIYAKARSAAPGYDPYALEAEWRQWVIDKGIAVAIPPRHFIGFCASRHAKAPLA